MLQMRHHKKGIMEKGIPSAAMTVVRALTIYHMVCTGTANKAGQFTN